MPEYNPSILGQVGRPQVEFDPIGIAQKSLQLKQQQMQLQGQQRLRDLAAQVDPNTPEGQEALVRAQAATGDVSGAITSQYTLARSAEQRALAAKNLQISMQQIAEGSRKHIADSAARAGAKAKTALLDPTPDGQRQAVADIAQMTLADAQPREADDPATAAAKEHLRQQWTGTLQKLPTMNPQELAFTLNQTAASGRTFEDWQKLEEKQTEQTKPASEFGKFAKDAGGNITDPSVQALWLKLHPRAVTSVNTGGGAGAAFNANSHDYSQPLPNSAAEGLARDFADGKPQQAITSRTPQWVADAIARGREIYKAANNGDDQGYGTTAGVLKKARTEWAPGGTQLATANAVDVATGHLAARDEYIEALKNHDTAALNRIGNYFKTQFGLSSAPNDLRTLNTLVAPEIAKVVKGSTQTNESEIKDIRAQLGDDLSSEIQKSGGQVFRGAMGTRLAVMENNYKTAYPGKSLARVLQPTTVKTFPQVFGGDASAQAPVTPAGKPATKINPADNKTYYLHSDGKYYDTKG